MPGRTFTPEFKLSVVKELESGAKRPAQLCREHEIDESVITRWRKTYREQGEAAFHQPRAAPNQPNEVEALERRVSELERLAGQLALENSVLKRALDLSRRTGGSR